ncbi:MAG TPA: AAA family ATPase [Lacipirellulaceae bacterium]|nr:AAA family ATPase [Lacipirellulaceae bacterium]
MSPAPFDSPPAPPEILYYDGTQFLMLPQNSGSSKFMSNQQSLPLKHWRLERWPFTNSPGIGQFYPTSSHNEALARIEYLVESKRRLGVLLGDCGVGKSLVLRLAAAQLRRQGCALAAVDALGASTREFLWQVASGLGTTPRDDAEVPWLWRQIADRISENRAQQVDTVLLVDDAGQSGPDMLTQLARLARLSPAPDRSPEREEVRGAWTIVLAAGPAQAARWDETIRNLVDLRIDLYPWTADDTIGYVQTALVDAGRIEPLFDEAALTTLHELSGGVPRQVARLADYALLAGAAAGIETIDAQIVEAASDEIDWPAAAMC